MKTKDLFRRLPPDSRLLLVRLRSMGDCLLLTGPVRALKEEFPGFRIAVLAEARFAPCFDGNPDFDEVISVRGKFAAAALLLKRRFAAVLNLHGGTTSLVYSCLTWGRRLGLERSRCAWLYHGLVPRPAVAMHTAEATLFGLRWLGVRREDTPPLRFELHPREAGRMRERFQNRPYVVIHPGALMETKRWSSARFASVARSLQQRGLTVALTCGPGEETFVNQVAKEVPDPVILLGLTIPELAELIRGATLFIGNDSGPLHLAAAVGTPCVAVWGSSDSRGWRPWKVEHRVAQNPFECNPCPGYRCLVADSPLCIESVSVEQVSAAVADLLTRSIPALPFPLDKHPARSAPQTVYPPCAGRPFHCKPPAFQLFS